MDAVHGETHSMQYIYHHTGSLNPHPLKRTKGCTNIQTKTDAHAHTQPAVEQARMLVESGAIGDVVITFSDFCINGSDVGQYPTDTIFDQDLFHKW